MKISANQLASSVRDSLLPCYLVSGNEPLLVSEALDAIRAAARDRGFSGRELYVAGPGFDWSDLSAAGAAMSLFAEQRIIELRLSSAKPGKQGAAAIVELLKHAGDDLLVLISAPKLDRGAAASPWAKTAESRGALVTIWPVDRRELPAWISARLRAAGLRPDSHAVTALADRVEGNLLAADQEIQKLKLLLGAGDVTLDDVDDAVGDSSRYDVFKLADAAVGGETARALRILGGLRAEGVEPVIVLWALTRELRVLGTVAERVQAGTALGAALQQSGVFRNRQSIVRACIARQRVSDIYRLLKIARRADAAAKGQSGEDAWQLASEIVLGLAMGGAKAA